MGAHHDPGDLHRHAAAAAPDARVHSHADHASPNRTALSATVHCLTGCAIGEVLGMVVGTALAMGTWHTVVLAIVVYIPGAMEAGLGSLLFWASLLGSLLVAGVVAFPLNRWLIGRGMGHAVLHAYHH